MAKISAVYGISDERADEIVGKMQSILIRAMGHGTLEKEHTAELRALLNTDDELMWMLAMGQMAMIGQCCS
jgi:hypothetical protein